MLIMHVSICACMYAVCVVSWINTGSSREKSYMYMFQHFSAIRSLCTGESISGVGKSLCWICDLKLNGSGESSTHTSPLNSPTRAAAGNGDDSFTLES